MRKALKDAAERSPDWAEARKRLALYEMGKSYHEPKK
jgi:hypothetical protein